MRVGSAEFSSLQTRWIGGERFTETAYLAEEHTFSGIPADTPFGRFVKSKAPPACAEHGVYFESEEIGVRTRADLPYNKRHD